MSRRRFYVPRDSIRDGIAALPSDQARHLRDVLRLGTGDMVEVFDGEGSAYSGEVELRGPGVFVRCLQSLHSLGSPDILILAAALIKSVRFEWMLQKATELGASEIIPIETRRSDIKIPDNKIKERLERWDRIVKEAAKQCRRFDAPRLRPPVEFSKLLFWKELAEGTKLLFDENAVDLWQPDKSLLSGKTIICVGPEGGWEGSEIEQAELAGFKAFSLGSWTLRAETAAIAAVAIVRHQINLRRK